MKKDKAWKIIVFFLMSGFFLNLAGCGGGEDSSGASIDPPNVATFNDWQADAQTLNGQITLPANSPLSLAQISVDVFDSSSFPTTDGGLTVQVPQNQIVDAYVMLPKRAGDSFPTIYLYTTLLPGETEIQLSPEETAVSMLMGRINQGDLVSAGTAAEVKQMIRNYGQNFISTFVEQIAVDPYILRSSNQVNVYNQVYEDAADACRTAIIAAAEAVASPLAMRFVVQPQAVDPGAISGSQLYVTPTQTRYDFAVYEDTTGLLGLDTWADLEDAGGLMTGQLKVENDTMLFAHYKITDLVTQTSLKNLSVASGISGMLGVAFHPDILGPQKGWTRLWWSGAGKFDVDFKSTSVQILTPQISDNPAMTSEDRQIGTGLAFRTGATALMTVVSSFVPIDSDGYKNWFVEMNDRGLLSAAYDKFAYGDIRGGIETLFWTFCDGTVMEKFIKDYLLKYIANSLDSDKVTAQFMNKFNQVASKIPITKIGLAVDMLKLFDDYATIPGEFSFDRVEFPFNLANAGPSPLTKVALDEPLPIITVTGMGLGMVNFGGNNFAPQVYLEAENSDGVAKLLTIAEVDVSIAPSGDSLWFELPREWAEIGSDIVGPIYINVAHHFIDQHGIDELISMELPPVEHEAVLSLDFKSNVTIMALSTSKPTRGEEMTLIGEGFAPVSYDDHVYFTDYTGFTAEAVVALATSTTLDVILPETLAIGPLSVEVELTDGSLSNRKTLSLHPRRVLSDQVDGTSFLDSLTVKFTQEEGFDIYYSLNGSGDVSYTGEISIDQTSHFYPYAKVTVNGIDYLSAVSDFYYTKCLATEDLVNGVCSARDTPATNQWVLAESTPFSDCSGIYINHTYSLGSWDISYTQSWGSYYSFTANGVYTTPPSTLKPTENVVLTTSTTTTTSASDGSGESYETLYWALSFNSYPLDASGKINFLGGATAILNQVISKAESSGNNSVTTQGTLSLPQQGWLGWGEYVVLQTSGGTISPTGCSIGFNNVYRWQ